jgi:chemotaxis protein MotB
MGTKRWWNQRTKSVVFICVRSGFGLMKPSTEALMPRQFKLLGKFIGLGILGLSLTGCVSAEQYTAVKMRAEQLAEQLGHSQTEISEANAQRDAAMRQLSAVNNNGQMQSAEVSNLTSQISDLQKENDALSQKYADAMSKFGNYNGPSALPPALNSELQAFAAQNPDLVDFDSSRGIVKFKSDVTFPVGDTTVSAKGREVLKRFASILTSAGADGYELLVAGHTDNQPVTNINTIKHGNPDNWYLSAHRAISVGHELITDGVSSSRMGVVGYADKRPVANNSTEAGKQANRRVEVLILPTTVTPTPDVASTDEPRPARRSHRASGTAVPAAATLSKDATPPSVSFTK